MREDKAIAQTLFSSLQQAHGHDAQQAVIDSFIAVVRRSGDISRGYRVLAALQELFEKSDGVIRATVTSAQELSREQKHSLAAKLQEQHHATAVTIEYRLVPEVLGGVSIKVGDMLYDDTLRHKLSMLANTLTH